MIISLNDFIRKYQLKNKVTSDIKIQNNRSPLTLGDVETYLRDRIFSSDLGMVNSHPTKSTHWVTYSNKTYLDSYGCSLPQKLSRFILKRNGHCLYSECKIQGLASKRRSYCAAYCLYIMYLTKVLGIDFKSGFSNLHYQMIQ